MKTIWIIFSIHLVMGIISVVFFPAIFQGMSHSGTVLLSLSLFMINVFGYLLLSLFLLKKHGAMEVIGSVCFFLGIGLVIWIVYYTTGYLGFLFFVYHITGYSSFLWYVHSLAQTNELLLIVSGALYSIVPSLLVLIGFYLRRLIRSRKVWKRIIMYMASVILSVVTVFLSSSFGERVETREELSNAFPIKTGFPLSFAELSYPKIDPPLPWTYGGFDCCTLSVVSWSNFWLSIMVMVVLFILVTEIYFLWKVKREG